MADQTWGQKLASMLSSKPTAQGTGNAVAPGAMQPLGVRAYQLHVAEARANGDSPLTPQAFAQQQGN